MSKKKIKVAYIVNELLRGGAQNIVLNTVRLLDKNRFEPVVIYLKSHDIFGTAANTLEADLSSSGIRVLCLGGRRKTSLIELFRLIALLRKENPDVVHTLLPYAGILGRIAARLSLKTKVLSTQCNTRVAYSPLAYWTDVITLPLAHAWTAASTGIELSYASDTAVFNELAWNNGRRHFTVTAGVDLRSFDARFDAASRVAKRNEISVPDDVPLVLSVARLVPWKGVEDLVCAAQYIVPSAHVAIVGWGELDSKLKAKAEQLGLSSRIHFLGVRADVPEIMKAADVYAQTHVETGSRTWMGPNLSQMEACAARLPSVSTRVPYIEELIEDEKTGLLARANDPKDIARAISALILEKSRSDSYASAARERVETKFSTEASGRAYEAIYELLVKES